MRLVRLFLDRLVVQLQLVQMDWKLDIGRGHNIFNLQSCAAMHDSFPQSCILISPDYLVYNFGVFPSSQGAISLALCTCDDHLARPEDQSSSFGFLKSHDDSCEPIRVVLRILGLPIDLSKFKLAPQVHGADNILNCGPGKIRQQIQINLFFQLRVFEDALFLNWWFLFLLV